MSDAVASRLRHAGLAGRTVTVKVRFGDFRTITRSFTTDAFDSGTAVARMAKTLLESVDVSAGVRLLGVTVSQLGAKPARQLGLFDAPGAGGAGLAVVAENADSAERAVEAIDEIRMRFGAGAIGPAALLGRVGLRVKRPGDTQWGPNADKGGLG
jgi:DNA polymerase IV